MWTGVVTNAGTALFAHWALGGTLSVEAARAGTGTVEADQLAGLTNVSGSSHALSIVDYAAQESGIEYTIELHAASSAYLAMQVGIFAKLDDGDETLIAIFQAGSTGEGIAVPSTSELPDFSFTFGALVEMANRSTLTVTIDPTVLVSRSQMNTELDKIDVGFFVDDDGYICQRLTGDEE